MLGYSDAREVLIWTQTTVPARVQLRYWEEGRPETARMTAPVTTSRESALIAKSIADDVRPSRRYAYEVYVDGRLEAPHYRSGSGREGPIPLRFQTRPRWRHTVEGRPPEFRVALGSCAYINEPGYQWEDTADPAYGKEYRIFEAIHEKSPDLMLWLGDGIYLREADWSTRTGIEHRWSYHRSTPHLRALLANTHHYAIWDDHDWGPNDIGREFWNRAETTRAFQLFWGNPSAGLPETPGIFTFFNWGDVNFILLDNRSYLTQPEEDGRAFGKSRAYIGQAQLDWLISMLRWIDAEDGFIYPSSFTVVAVGGQVLTGGSNPHAWPSYEEEWQEMIDRIVDEGIRGVLFVSGDVHFSEVNRLTYIGGGEPGVPGKAGEAGKAYRFLEVTASPLTSGPTARPRSHANRVDLFPQSDRDFINIRNFTLFDFRGPLDDRRLEVRFFDSAGRRLTPEPVEGDPPPFVIRPADLGPQP